MACTCTCSATICRSTATCWRTCTTTKAAAAMLDWLSEPLDYRFMRLALVEVTIIGVVAGFLGSYVVMRGLAFVGDAISHAVFPGIVIAFLAKVNILIGGAAFG